MEQMLEDSGLKKVIKAGADSNFLESMLYVDRGYEDLGPLLFFAIPCLAWDSDHFRAMSMRRSRDGTAWKPTLSLFEYRFGFVPGFDINGIFNQAEALDSMGMDHKAIVVQSITFLCSKWVLNENVSDGSGNGQQAGSASDPGNNGDIFGPIHGLMSAIKDAIQSSKDEFIQSFQDKILYIDLIVQSNFSKHQKVLFGLHTSLKIELIAITKIVEAQIEALKNLDKNIYRDILGEDYRDSNIEKLVEERNEFKKYFEDFLAEIKISQGVIIELAKIETTRQQQIALKENFQEMMSEMACRQTEATEMQKMMGYQQLETAMKSMEYNARAQQFREETTLVFTIVTTIFLPLSFFTSYYGMNTTDMRSTTSTQNDFWTVCGPISVAVIIIALSIGCRKQIARTALYQWVTAGPAFLISRVLRTAPASDIDRSSSSSSSV